MLAVVKEPHIELALNGIPADVLVLLEYISSHFAVEILSNQEDSAADDEELVNIEETDWWKANATPGHVLAGYRLKHDMTQEQLAEKSGIHHVVISAYENDRRKISRRAAIRLARALGEDEDTFYTRLMDL